MRHGYSGQLITCIVCFVVVMLGGCATSSPSQFYTLNALKNPEPVRQTVLSAGSVVVAVGPIILPHYLDKFEIITRSGTNELKIHEFHRWAEGLDSSISRAIIENLWSLLPSDQFSVVRWIPGMQINAVLTYQVTIEIIRFDILPEDKTVFEADWIINKKGSPLTMQRSIITEPIKGNNFDEMVAAMSKAVEDFSHEIADILMSQNQGD